ncbi:recombinase family protein [Seohaeicola zhoushanensis]
MERPGLVRLLEDVRAGRIDVIVVYKVDRLTRALSDFAKMVEVFDGAGVSFVSVTQAFNTTSSMGRLTLNVLLSFAQFEREVTAERIRDKVGASKRKGMWMGGAVPMGYDAIDKCLVANPREAEAVRVIFREYVRLGSVPELIRRLEDLGIVSKVRADRYGRVSGGTPYSRGALYHLLRNPIYIGKVRHGQALHAGQHAALIDDATWAAAKQSLDANGGGRIAMERKPAARWLDGVLFDQQGRSMKTDYASKKLGSSSARKRYWYYVSRTEHNATEPKPTRLPAQETETAVCCAVARLLQDKARLLDAIATGCAGTRTTVLKCAETLIESLQNASASERDQRLSSLVRRVDVLEEHLRITFDLDGTQERSSTSSEQPLVFDTPFRMNQNGRARPIVVRTGLGEAKPDADLIALVADARRWMKELTDGSATSIAAITEREGLRSGSVSRILPLAWLAPDIAAAILAGHQPAELSAKRLRDLPDLPWTGPRNASSWDSRHADTPSGIAQDLTRNRATETFAGNGRKPARQRRLCAKSTADMSGNLLK